MAALHGRATIGRRTLLKALLTGGIGAATGVGSYGYLYERHHLEITRADVAVAGIPRELSGLRIGLITDIHRSAWVSDDDVRHAAAMLMGERPDLIVLGGDYVTRADRRYMTPAAEAFRTLSAPHGVFAILGNHDDDRAMPAALSKIGAQVLRDARTRLMISGVPLELAGIRFWTRRSADIEDVVRGASGTVVLLAHDPRRLSEAAGLGIPLVLSGHTHGGQVVLPLAGALAAQKFPVVAGVGRRLGTTIFVSRGVGTVYVPLRVNCPPEVAVLTLGLDGPVNV
ncbi:MAG: metallophosphoesterase [Acidobacteria bacterium]|nr:metallophosphoesterase [Acidobacteriota bacterium]